jgi:hypothetical protein
MQQPANVEITQSQLQNKGHLVAYQLKTISNTSILLHLISDKGQLTATNISRNVKIE